MEKININKFEDIVNSSKTAFLCGNGFSINFSDDFSNIYDRLYESHRILMRKGKFSITSNTVLRSILKDNYNAIFNYLKNITEKKLFKIFEDGIDFALSITNNNNLIREIEKSDSLTNLSFGKNELFLVNEIAEKGKKLGVKGINIEYWTILIFAYFLIKKLFLEIYSFPDDNDFIFMIRIGQTNKNKVIEDDNLQQFVLTNGFNLYYRMLMSTAIFSKGKAIDFSLLEKVEKLDIVKLKQWLQNYKVILTLNYDLILENLLDKDIVHLHGQFFLNKRESVYNQSLGLQWDDNTYISFSDILIGDYFINKTYAGIINSLCNNPKDKKTKNVSEILERALDNNVIGTMVIFGMGIDNDQHILRNIMMSLIRRIDIQPTIIYCFFTEEDIRMFREQYKAVITFNEQTNELVNKIKVSFIDSRELLTKFFYKIL